MHTSRRAPAALLLLLACAAASTHSAGASWSDCSTGPTLFKVSDVTLEPETVKPGDVAKFAIKAESARDVRGGTVQMVVHYAGLPIWTQVDSLCDKADCPIKKGPTEVRYSQLFPSITPPGSYTVTLNGHSGDDSLFCVTVAFQVVPPEASEVAGSWAAALQGAARQQALATHRKRLA